MTKKESVVRAIQFEEVRPVPYHLVFDPQARRLLQEYYGADDLDRLLGNYLVWLSPDPPSSHVAKEHGNEQIEDEFGVIWQKCEEAKEYPVFHPLREPSLKGYNFPDPYAEGRFDKLVDEINAYQDLFVIVMWRSIFEKANFLRGVENLLIDLSTPPIS